MEVKKDTLDNTKNKGERRKMGSTMRVRRRKVKNDDKDEDDDEEGKQTKEEKGRQKTLISLLITRFQQYYFIQN